ncbi:MAG: hypothetical protein CMJ83_10630 [Planctomycetes bacterium]|nr:hypothetical protein [Planctomycetota bacterium]
MRTLCLLSILSLLSASVIAQGFELSAPGASIGATPDPEGWVSDGGTVTVAPSGAATPISGFPSEGSQWCIVRSAGAVGGFTVPMGGPAPFPITAGDTGNVRRTVTLPTGGTVSVSFDFTYVTPECPNGNNGGSPAYNDWFSVDLVDPATGLSVLNLVYRDTWSTQLVGPAFSPHEGGSITSSFCTNTLEESVPGTVHTVSVAVPAALHGMTLDFVAQVGDGNDAAFNSWFYLDNVQAGGGPPPAGPLTVDIVSVGAGMYQLDIDAPMTVATGNYYRLYVLISGTPATPTGSGSFLGLNFDAVTASILQLPLGAAPLHFQMTASSWSFGPFAGAPGLTIDYLGVGILGASIAEITSPNTATF